jgi:hypothetical protein
MCTVLLPPGGYPIAVKYISYHIEKKGLRPHTFRTDGVIDEMGTVWKQHIVTFALTG